MTARDKELTERLAVTLDNDPMFRRLLAGMLLEANGDLEVFIQSYKQEQLNIDAENLVA